MTIASGTVGTCAWSISDTGVLDIGAGNINIWAISSSSWPWHNYRSQVTAVNFSGSVTFSSPSFGDISMVGFFSDMTSMTSITNFARINTSNVKNMNSLFYNCSSLRSINLSSISTAAVTTMAYMFYNCAALTSLDVSMFNTSNVTNMAYMFNGCSALSSLTLGSLNTSNVTDMRSMFSGCSSLPSVSLSGFNTSSVTNMSSMFYRCSLLTSLNLASVDTSSVTSMRSFLYGCSSLTSVDLSSFDTSASSYMSSFFGGCNLLSTVKLGASFYIPGDGNLFFVVSGKSCENRTNGIVIADNDSFNALTAAERQGTWIRGVDSHMSVTAFRSTNGVADEDGADATITVTYATEAETATRMLYVYHKLASAASYPGTPTRTVALTGDSGTQSVTISNLGDDAYDFKVQFYDGENYYTAYPSIQTNIRLLTIDRSGNVTILGTLTQLSDKRVKEHVGFLAGDAVDFVRGLNPVLFGKDGRRNLGFYAQDVRAAEPDGWNTATVVPVKSNAVEDHELLTLNYSALIAPLTAYAQFLEQRIDRLEARLSALEGSER